MVCILIRSHRIRIFDLSKVIEMIRCIHLPDLNAGGLWARCCLLMACFMPEYCLRSLEKWPPLHRAFRQSVGIPAAISRRSLRNRQPDCGPAEAKQWSLAPGKQATFAHSHLTARHLCNIFVTVGMTELEKQHIEALTDNELELNSFFRLYPEKAAPGYVAQQLQTGLTLKDPLIIEYNMLLGYVLDVYDHSLVDLLNKLLLEDWHHRHEDITLLLQQLKSHSSIEALYLMAIRQLIYLSYDDSYALARKCIHALGDINTDASWEKLRLIAALDIPILNEKIDNQKRYKGRSNW